MFAYFLALLGRYLMIGMWVGVALSTAEGRRSEREHPKAGRPMLRVETKVYVMCGDG